MNESDSTTCPHCGDPLDGRPHRKQKGASDECRKAYNRERANRFTAAHPGYYSKYDTADCYEHVCPVCCKTFKNHHDDAVCHCSQDCYQRRNRQMILHPHPSPCSVLHPMHPARTWAPSSSGRVWMMGWCARCAESFVIVDQLEARFCSLKCLRKACKDARRASEHGVDRESYRRVDIYERDGWRCHICGRKTRRDVHWSHPEYPTIDHLIPVSKGGADAPYNLACAHRHCNCIKSDTGGAQLRLIA